MLSSASTLNCDRTCTFPSFIPYCFCTVKCCSSGARGLAALARVQTAASFSQLSASHEPRQPAAQMLAPLLRPRAHPQRFDRCTKRFSPLLNFRRALFKNRADHVKTGLRTVIHGVHGIHGEHGGFKSQESPQRLGQAAEVGCGPVGHNAAGALRGAVVAGWRHAGSED